MQKLPSSGLLQASRSLLLPVLFAAAATVFLAAGCSGGGSDRAEYAYVAVTEAGLRDHVSTIYNKTGVVRNGERLQVLERMQNKRFVRVRSPRGEEGWVQERYLADQPTFDEFQRLAGQFKNVPAQATATTEDQVKVHVLPGRKTAYLYLLNEKQKVELIQRQTIDRNSPPLQLKDEKSKEKDSDTDSSDEEQPKTTENKDGMPYDFNQARVFTWNLRRHRYETAYRERDLNGVLPVTLGRQDFEKEGNLRTFTLRVKDDGGVKEKLYKFSPPIVRRVLAPGEEPSRPHKKKSSRGSR